MPSTFDKLFKSDAEIKKDIIGDFTSELLLEVQKLVDKHGKNELIEILNKNT